MLEELHEGPPRTRPLDIQVVKRHAKRLAQWTDLSTSESQELSARAFGATGWQALLKRKAFSSDEDLLATIGLHLEERHKAQSKLLQDRLHIGPALSKHFLKYWQPTAVAQRPSVHTPDLSPSRFSEAPPTEVRCLAVLGHHPAIPESCVLVLVTTHRLDPDKADVITLELATVRLDRVLIAIRVDDIALIDLAVHGSPPLAKAWARLREEPNQKSRMAFERILAKPSSLTFPTGMAVPGARAKPARVTASWLRIPVHRDVVLEKFAQWKPWSRDAFPGLSRSNEAFFSTTHAGWRFEVLAYNQITVVAYGNGDRHGSRWVQVGVGSIAYLDAREEGAFNVRESGFYLVKYGNQPRGGPLLGFDSSTAQLASEQIGLSDYLATRQPIGFFESEAGLAFASWISTDSSPGRKLLKLGQGDSYLGPWIEPAINRMHWELVRAGRM